MFPSTTTFEVTRYDSQRYLLDYWSSLSSYDCALILAAGHELGHSHTVARIDGELLVGPEVDGYEWLLAWEARPVASTAPESHSFLPAAAPAPKQAPAAPYHFTYHQHPYGRNFCELTAREMEALLRSGESGQLADYTIFQLDTTTYETMRTFCGGGEYLAYYDRYLSPPPVVATRVDKRKGRHPNYSVSFVLGSGQLSTEFTGSLPDCCAHCASLVLDFPQYLKVYRALRELPVWSSAFVSIDNASPVVIIISKHH